MSTITVEVIVARDLESVWKLWNEPEDIKAWMHASEDWECTASINEVRIGGRFVHTLAAKDGSASFDLAGMYDEVREFELLAYTLDDGRGVVVTFEEVEGDVKISEQFEVEAVNPEEMQRDGWQATLDNFKKYAEE